MTTPRPSLDPRKNPWKRGDLCTLGFAKHGFVLNHTAEYLEVRWMGGSVERIPAKDIDNLSRIAHADDSLSPGGSTNLQDLEAIEALSFISGGITERMKTVKNEDEKKELDRLARRIFATDRCEWDKKPEENY